MDLRTHTKITVLVEKISYLLKSIESQGQVSKIDKDLMVNYVKELYETTLQVQTSDSQNYNQHTNQQAPQYPPSNEQQSNYYPPNFQNKPSNGNAASPNGNGNSLNNNSNGSSRKSISEMLNEIHSVEKPSINESMKAGPQGLADKLKQTPIKELSTYVSLNKRFAFINLLFNGDAMKYDDALTFIDQCKSYQESMAYVQNKIMKEYKWKEDDDLVSEFLSLVLRRFLV